MKLLVICALFLPAAAMAQTSRSQDRYDAASSKEKTGSAPDRIICRTALETGSLVKRTRRCMTSRDWAARMRNENSAARDVVRENAGLVVGN